VRDVSVEDRARVGRAIRMAERGLGRTAPQGPAGALLAQDARILGASSRLDPSAIAPEWVLLSEHPKSGRKVLYLSHGPEQGFAEYARRLRAHGVVRLLFGAMPIPRSQDAFVRALRGHGIEVTPGVMAARALRVGEAYRHARCFGRPFVVLKAAMTLDGHIATRTGDSRWISSEASRRWGHRLRNNLDAVLVGRGTVVADDPLLTARIRGGRNPLRVVLDRTLAVPEASQLIRTAGEVPTLIFTGPRASKARRARFEERGVEVVPISEEAGHRLSVQAILDHLFSRNIHGLLVEGGATVHGSFIEQRRVDKAVVFIAPKMVGGAAAPAMGGGRGLPKIQDALQFDGASVRRLGGDVVIEAYRKDES
jgi:diaminohydroxyphosphoribosylaminopyrimidine deaminase / 5-amino-6-(5-phosphoribosylamino)uracil reductase